MAVLDNTTMLGSAFQAITDNMTGDRTLTLLILLIIILAACIAFTLPIEVGIIVAIPFVMFSWLYGGVEMKVIISIVIFFMAIVVFRRLSGLLS